MLELFRFVIMFFAAFGCLVALIGWFSFVCDDEAGRHEFWNLAVMGTGEGPLTSAAIIIFCTIAGPLALWWTICRWAY